jgi:hypothetical protein
MAALDILLSIQLSVQETIAFTSVAKVAMAFTVREAGGKGLIVRSCSVYEYGTSLANDLHSRGICNRPDEFLRSTVVSGVVLLT